MKTPRQTPCLKLLPSLLILFMLTELCSAATYDYWRENSTTIWTKVNLTSGTPLTLYITSNSTSASNCKNIFSWGCDDFEDSSTNNFVSTATESINSTNCISGNCLKLTGSSYKNSIWYRADASTNYTLEFNYKSTTTHDNYIQPATDNSTLPSPGSIYQQPGSYSDWRKYACVGWAASGITDCNNNTWCKFQMFVISGTIRNIITDGGNISLGCSGAGKGFGLNLNFASGTGQYLDNVFIRQFTENEPSISCVSNNCTITSINNLINYEIKLTTTITDNVSITEVAAGTSPSIILNTSATAQGTYYNETSNEIIISTLVSDFTQTNTTHYLDKNGNPYQETLNSAAGGNFTSTYPNLEAATYTIYARTKNSTSEYNTSTRTIIIYGFVNNITTPTNGQNITRHLNVTYTDTITPTGTINISNHNISILNSDLSLNFTINSSTNASQYYDLYQRNLTIGTYYIQLISKDTNNNTHTNRAAFNLTKDAELNITARYIFTNQTINNFTINITDEVTGTTEQNITTNNKSTFLIIKNRNYTIVIDATTYALSNLTNRSFNATLNNYTFYLYTDNSVTINIYDESDFTTINDSLISITFSNNITALSYSTNNGTYYKDGLTEGTWEVRFYSTNYSYRIYTISVANRSTQTLNAYLIPSTYTSIFTIRDSLTQQALEDTSFSMLRQQNSSWVIVESRTSDITGSVQVGYLPGIEYKFIITRTGYNSKTFYLNPVLYNTYDIYLDKTTTLTTAPEYQGVSIIYYPAQFYSNETNNFTWAITSPEGILTDYKINITYPGGFQENTGNNAVGEEFNYNFNITGANSTSQLILRYCYDTTIGSLKCFKSNLYIIGAYGNQSFIANKNNTYGLGLLERIGIVTLITIAIAGLLTFFTGEIVGAISMIAIFGFFNATGFIPIWAILPSILIAFLWLTWREQ